jgi:hypothetical protein
MKVLLTSIVIVSLVCACPGSAQEKQAKSLHAERDAIELILLRQKSVREELKIDSDGAKKIIEFTHKQHHKAHEIHALPEAEQAAKWEELVKENDEFLHKSITPEQHKRLKQIAMQSAGLLFVTAPKIAKELKLTSEQETEAKKLQHESQEKTFEVLKAATKEARNEKLAALRESNNEKLHKLFTEEQKTKWKEYVGEPFKGQLVVE